VSFLSRKITDMLVDQLSKPRKGKQGEVHLPGFLGILGTVCGMPFLLLAVISLLKEELGAALCFLLLASLGGAMIVGYFNCRITYDSSGFTAKTFSGSRGVLPMIRSPGSNEMSMRPFFMLGNADTW